MAAVEGVDRVRQSRLLLLSFLACYVHLLATFAGALHKEDACEPYTIHDIL